jgi:arsenite methyltransferase
VSGALAERVFVAKLESVGFTDITVLNRQPFGMDRAADYPLFTTDLIDLMDRLLSPRAKERVATAVTLTARRAG